MFQDKQICYLLVFPLLQMTLQILYECIDHELVVEENRSTLKYLNNLWIM